MPVDISEAIHAQMLQSLFLMTSNVRQLSQIPVRR